MPPSRPSPYRPVVRAASALSSFLLVASVLHASHADDDEPSPIAAEIAAAEAAIRRIETTPGAGRTFANTVEAIDDALAALHRDTGMRSFLARVSTDATEREQSRQAAADRQAWISELTRRPDLFRAVRAFADTSPDLDGDAARLLEHVLRDFRREGMALGPEAREQLSAIEDDLIELEARFRKNIDEDETFVLFDAGELAGVPQSFLDSLPRSGELYVCELRGPNLGRILGSCQVEGTRLRIGAAAGRRGGRRNVEVLEQMLRLRNAKARLLGYDHAADQEIETRMAGHADAVWSFYAELRPKLRKKALADFATYEAAKREHLADPAAELHAWDLSYYKNWLLRERYAVDSEKLREYFPLDRVTEGLFAITQALYGLEYRDVSERAAESGRPIWHPDVRLFEVWDTEREVQLGEFYLDLFPRAGKYGHAAQFSIIHRKEWADGTLTEPVAALVCNFTPPSAEAPALLSHDEVETYFHEFGHCLHALLGESRFAWFAGTRVARDFVEAPSQMFENWVWDAQVLEGFARHYQTGEPLPSEVLEGMLAARNLGSGMAAEAQVFLGVLDLTYHTDEDGVIDTTAVRQDVYADTRLFEPLEGLFGQAAFRHLVSYEAGYYGYLWSLVYAQDMFGRFRELGLMNPEAGRAFRAAVLGPGGTRDELEMVRTFLGREPSSDAFLEHLGVHQGAPR